MIPSPFAMLVRDDDFEDAIARVRYANDLVVDTETTGLSILAERDHMVGIAVLANGVAMYFPYRHASSNLAAATLPALITELSGKPWIGHNCKFDIEVLYMEGMPVPAVIYDTMLAAHLVNENEYVYQSPHRPQYRSDGKPVTSHALKFLAKRYLNADSADEEKKLLAKLKGRKSGMEKLPAEDVEPYARKDVQLTYRLYQHYIPKLRRWRLYDLWIECNKYCTITAAMEIRGFTIDEDRAALYSGEATREEQRLTAQLRESTGIEDLNIKSPKQLSAAFGVKSTAKDALKDAIAAKHPKADQMETLLLLRKWVKVNNTYYGPLVEKCDSHGILHPDFNLIGTVAGRPSCSNPNLQAIPRQDEIYRVKDIFAARDRYLVVSADYSQAEIRWGTYYAREVRMAELLMQGLDIHTETANSLNIPRFVAKQINFAVIYGIQAKSLSRELRISEVEAKRYLLKYHKRYPKFQALFRAAQSAAERNGYIRMFTGRVRRYNAHSPERKASSNLIQGAVAEMLRITITRIAKEVPEAKILLQVHDQIIMEIPEGRLFNPTLSRVKTIMEDWDLSWDRYRIPMLVDIKVGKTWGGVKEWNPAA